MSFPSDDMFLGWSEAIPSPSAAVRGLRFEPPFRGVVDFGDADSAAKAVYNFNDRSKMQT
jgi:hypothetical protein